MANSDPHSKSGSAVNLAVIASARSAYAITPDNANDVTTVTRAVSVNVAGDIKVDMADSGTVTVTVVAGFMYPWQVKRVYLTGTTATGITGWY